MLFFITSNPIHVFGFCKRFLLFVLPNLNEFRNFIKVIQN